PPDYALWPTMRRLLRLWREQWRLVALGLACAVAYATISLTIPILIARAIDHAIVRHNRPLWEYVVPILALAVVRLAINFTRRYATARVGVRIEARMRELLYGAYLRFPRAFYDRHPTGLVVSRATNDLYPIRYFIGWGMVQGFGREDDVRGRFANKATGVRDTVLRQAGVEAKHLPGLFFLPTLSVAIVVYFGGRRVIHGSLSYGEFALFIQLLLQLVWPL